MTKPFSMAWRLFLLFVGVALAPRPCRSDAVAPSVLENFEGDAVPEGWSVSGGSLAVTGDRFKSGAKSLLWSWSSAEATLTCSWPEAFRIFCRPPPMERSLGFWLYNDNSVEQVLRLEFFRGTQVAGRCWYCLNFRGWRCLGAPYAQVIGNPKQRVDGFRLIAPRA